MKPTSNILRAAFALLLMVLGAQGLSASGLFDQVPSGDPTFTQFHRLEKWGLLPQGTVHEPATRYEAAEWIVEGRRRAEEKGLMVVAQLTDDLDLSGPSVVIEHHDKAQPAPDATPAPAGETSSETSSEPSSEEVKQTFQTLQEAYDYELGQIKGDVKKVKGRLDDLEAQDYKMWRQVKGLSTNATISLHGFGRGGWFATQLSDMGNQTLNKGNALLDLEPTGVVSKEVSWNGIFRMYGNMATGDSGLGGILERVSIQLNPSFISATLGDFNLSWTPLTLWNRDSRDLLYKPEVIARWDDYVKYPLFMDHSPDLPFRGVRLSTEVEWPGSKVMDSFKVETFAHMIGTGFNNGYFAHHYSAWLFGAMSEMKATKYASLGAYGLLYDEPLNTDLSTAIYKPLDPTTWAQRYQIGSLQPKLDFPIGGDFSLGAEMESAFSIYQDDKLNPDRRVTDYAMIGGPRLRYQKSVLSFNLMDVGYNYFSPLAQIRQQDDNTLQLTGSPLVLYDNPASDPLGRAGSIFRFYNRLQDNVFPYGMATPNRKGAGAELDWKSGENDAWQVKAKVYAVKEIRENETINAAGTDMTVVDAWGPVTVLNRKFQYFNIGPKVDLAALWGLKNKLEAGFDYRAENTTTTWGTLKGETMILSLTAGLNSWLELEGTVGSFSGKGVEVGYLGTTLARYSYWYENTDLGYYEPFAVDQETAYGILTAKIKINRHSNLAMDAMAKSDKGVVGTSGTNKTQTLDVVYEVLF